MTQIWLEKHRPELLSDIVGNRVIISKLKDLSREENIKSMIFSGPPGCGKTTAILALCREVLGANFKNATLELNASDERGIDVIREKVKEFAERKVTLPSGQHKVVILDEADSLTEAAQQALRMIISDYSDTTRFVFSCNDSSKIIEPIQSRCAVLRFSRLSDEEISSYIGVVAHKEGIEVEKSGLEALVFIAEGDMRNAINNLQAVAVSSRGITKEAVFAVCDVPKLGLIKEMFINASRGNLEAALRSFGLLWAENHCVHDVITYMGRVLEKMDEIDFDTKFFYMARVGELKVRDSIGLGTKTQIVGTIAELADYSFKRHNKAY